MSILAQVMNLFVSAFKLQINEEVAKFLSFNMEASIYQLHNAERDYKAYLAKAKTLAFNLKKNEVIHSFCYCVVPEHIVCIECNRTMVTMLFT